MRRIRPAGGIFGFPRLVYSPRYSRAGWRGRRLPSPQILEGGRSALSEGFLLALLPGPIRIPSAGVIYGFPRLVYSPRYLRGGRRGRRLPSPPLLNHTNGQSVTENICRVSHTIRTTVHFTLGLVFSDVHCVQKEHPLLFPCITLGRIDRRKWKLQKTQQKRLSIYTSQNVFSLNILC